MFSYFDRVYVIHLPNPQRRAAIQEQFDAVGIRGATFLHAARPDENFKMSNMRRSAQGEFGCSISHIKAVAHAIADGARCPLFLEDDIVFRPDTVKDLAVALDELPGSWDVLYLGGHPRGPASRFSSRLVRVGWFGFAEAYAISRKSLVSYFDFWCNRIGKQHALYDVILGEFAAQHESYCVYPTLCSQPPGVSQISGKEEDKSALIAKGWLNNLIP